MGAAQAADVHQPSGAAATHNIKGVRTAVGLHVKGDETLFRRR
jgi:hypothetical protein